MAMRSWIALQGRKLWQVILCKSYQRSNFCQVGPKVRTLKAGIGAPRGCGNQITSGMDIWWIIADTNVAVRKPGHHVHRISLRQSVTVCWWQKMKVRDNGGHCAARSGLAVISHFVSWGW